VFEKLVRKVGDKCLGQRISWKFFLKVGKETDIFEMLKEAFGEEVMLRARVFEALKWFSERKGLSFLVLQPSWAPDNSRIRYKLGTDVE
jgi:hypothetical protein